MIDTLDTLKLKLVLEDCSKIDIRFCFKPTRNRESTRAAQFDGIQYAFVFGWLQLAFLQVREISELAFLKAFC